MNRAALLPSVGDPFILAAWLFSFEKYWKTEVNNLYVLIHGSIEKEVIQLCKNLVESVGGIVFVEAGPLLDHGDAIRYLLEKIDEEYVVLLEDDCWILKSNALEEQFSRIESGNFDVIGSTRGCTGPNIIKAIEQTFNLTGNSPEHSLKDCPNLWPNCLFAKRSDLLNTDRNFNAKHWPPGERIEELNFICNAPEASDTFVWASIQLRAMGLRIGYVHQYHCGPNDLANSQNNKGLFAVPQLPWVHFGSLSSLIVGNALLRDENHHPLGSRGAPTVSSNNHWHQYDPQTKLELIRRISIAKLMREHFPAPGQMSYFNEVYDNAIERALVNFNFDREVYRGYQQAYKKMMPQLFKGVE